MNKFLVYFGLALSAILFVENTVIGGSTAYIFLSYGNPGFLVLVSTLIGVAIGFGLKGFSYNKNKNDDENYDF